MRRRSNSGFGIRGLGFESRVPIESRVPNPESRHRSVITTLQAPQRLTLTLVGRVRRRDRRSIHPLHPPPLDFFRCRRGRQIFVKLPRVDLRYVTVGEPAHDYSLFSAEGSPDLQFVPHAEQPVRFRRLPIDFDPAASTRLLGFGPSPEQTGDVEPDVQTDRFVAHLPRTLTSDREIADTFGVPARLRVATPGGSVQPLRRSRSRRPSRGVSTVRTSAR